VRSQLAPAVDVVTDGYGCKPGLVWEVGMGEVFLGVWVWTRIEEGQGKM